MVWGGVKDRSHARSWSTLVPQALHIRRKARVLDLTPPCRRVLRCVRHGPLAPLPPLPSPVAWLQGPGGVERLLLLPLPAPAGGAGGSTSA
jgi:hypothetical protein